MSLGPQQKWSKLLICAAGGSDRFKTPADTKLTKGTEEVAMPINHHSAPSTLKKLAPKALAIWKRDRLTACFCINTFHRGIECTLAFLVKVFGCEPEALPASPLWMIRKMFAQAYHLYVVVLAANVIRNISIHSCVAILFDIKTLEC